ncbi:exodeoxyribonuclease V beta subunit [Neisseria perflava]|nr:exodeoxyribonuclease V beta subunit [Neisseria perflava]
MPSESDFSDGICYDKRLTSPIRHTMTATVQAFDPLTIPVSGTNLIEASAGTGKTYGIAALFTRLIVLEQMPVESILVVTFTKAATAELKTRLRLRLDEALQVLESVPDAAEDSDGLASYCAREHAGDEFLTALLQQALAQESQARLIVRLKAAIGQFDNAAIYTIHGFCQRVLRDYAFLCQAPFDVELAEDSRDRLLIPAQDFWRERVSNNPTLARLVFDKQYTPQKMLAQIKTFVSRPYLVFRRPEGDLQSAQEQAAGTWEKVRSRLAALEETFWRIFPSLSGTYYKKPTFTALFESLKQAAESSNLPKAHDKFPMFAADVLEEKQKKGQSPEPAAFADLQALANLGRDLLAVAEAEQAALTCLQLDLLDYINAALAEQKKSRRERGFDDLLLDVHYALTANPHADALAQAVADNWRVALIDEFQDTDPLQYEIFRKIFISQERPLFLVGDPKQAIYSFRGADIYAYLQAAQDAQAHYTLAVNYRSHAKLINGIGALFRQKKRPFVLADIDYADVGAKRADSRLNPPRPAIQIRWLHSSDTEPLHKDVLRQRAAEYCADEIAHALNEAAQGCLNLKDKPLQSGDIAVLVRTNNEGMMVAQALKRRRIQSVSIARNSVFATEEARALASLLDFWLNPRQAEPLRFVLGGVLFRYTAEQLYALNHNEADMLAWMDSAANAAAQWQQQGFYAAMQQFAADHHIETHLISDGNERSLTNYHQLLEHLAAEDEQSHSPAALQQWLLAQISLAQNGGDAAENKIVRLESDEALVKIVTMHASKGLQYPLVYCPFVWDAADSKPDDWQILHRRNADTELLAKHQLDETDTLQLADETAAENLRLLYVALTRAEEQLNIYAAYCKTTADNSFAYLLEGTPESSREAVRAVYENESKSAPKNAPKGEGARMKMTMLKANWLRFAETQSNNENIEFAFTEDVPQSSTAQDCRDIQTAYRAAPLSERGFRFIRHTSFTGLSRHVKAVDSEREELQPSIDPAESMTRPSENRPSAADDGDPLDIHHFPRGTNAGVCLHEILEQFDFKSPADMQSEQTAATLERYGFDSQWLPAVNTMLDHCRTTALTGATALADIPPRQRLAEMGFTLYMQDFNLPQLRRWFADPAHKLPPECTSAADLLDFKDVAGFLSGFIDMVYQDSDGRVCIIDYKSNHLGSGEAAYTPQAMNEAMAHHHYYLQALIYAIAVARYFKLRGQPLPQIAVRYLFLRGINGSDNGIWQWDIDTADLATWL